MYIAEHKDMGRGAIGLKEAFLNGVVCEDISVQYSQEITPCPSCCCNLVTATYELNQGPLEWLKRFCTDLCNVGFEKLLNAPCVFLNLISDEGVISLFVYVGDIIISASSEWEWTLFFASSINHTKRALE